MLFSELLEVADLLKIDYQVLLNCLIKGSSKWSHVDVCLEIDAISALRIRNSLCRILYGRLFTWIITKINEALKVNKFLYQKLNEQCYCLKITANHMNFTGKKDCGTRQKFGYFGFLWF